MYDGVRLSRMVRVLQYVYHFASKFTGTCPSPRGNSNISNCEDTQSPTWHTLRGEKSFFIQLALLNDEEIVKMQASHRRKRVHVSTRACLQWKPRRESSSFVVRVYVHHVGDSSVRTPECLLVHLSEIKRTRCF